MRPAIGRAHGDGARALGPSAYRDAGRRRRTGQGLGFLNICRYRLGHPPHSPVGGAGDGGVAVAARGSEAGGRRRAGQVRERRIGEVCRLGPRAARNGRLPHAGRGTSLSEGAGSCICGQHHDDDSHRPHPLRRPGSDACPESSIWHLLPLFYFKVQAAHL